MLTHEPVSQPAMPDARIRSRELTNWSDRPLVGRRFESCLLRSGHPGGVSSGGGLSLCKLVWAFVLLQCTAVYLRGQSERRERTWQSN